MATSGTINGTISGTRPYLRINWSRIETDVGGNRSKLKLDLYLMHPYTVRYSAAKSGVLQGTSFTSSTRVNGTGSTLLRTQEIWVGHNADGGKTQTLSASFNIAISYSGSQLSQLTVSGPAAIDAIPRGSTLSAFSFASSLQIGTKVNINYTVTRHSGNFRHQFQLRDGSVTVAQWDNVDANGSSSLELTGAQVNTILGRMSTVTSKTFTLRLSTRSSYNGGWIGSSVTRDATVSVNGNVEPIINSTSATPIGNSWAVGKGLYVQGQTGVQADFSSNARGGAGVKSRSISIGSLGSGGSVVGGVFRHSHSRVNTSGNITITYTITDTRNRSASSTRTVNFRAYTPPQITSFSAGRSSPTSSTVTVKSQGSIHGIGGENTGTMTVTQQGVSGNVQSISLNNTTPSFNNSFNRTVATTASADFTITVTDSLGNRATSTTTIGTAFMEFSIRKGTGVGIGKVHQRGVLDVDGDAYFNNTITNGIDELSYSGMTTQNNMGSFYPASAANVGAIVINVGKNNIMFTADITIRSYDFNLDLKVGAYTYIANANWHSTSVVGNVNRDVTVRFRTSGAGGDRYIVIGDSDTSWGAYLQVSVNNVQSGYGGKFNNKFGVSLSTSYPGSVQTAGYTLSPLMEIATRGINGNGDWYRFSNGLQICITVFTSNFFKIGQTVYVDLPKEFNTPYYTGFVGGAGNYWLEIEQSSAVGVGPNTATQARVQVYNSTYHARGDAVGTYRLITIGRWK